MPDIKLGPDRLQTFWVREEPESQCGGRWLVVIHGGLWQDPRINRMNANHLLATLGSSSRFQGAASLDYRLSPSVKHPAHYNDVADQMKCLINLYRPESIVLVGHSAGAFLAAQLVPNFPHIEHCVGLEGIYDLRSLVDEYPDYRPAIENAFGPDSTHWPQLEKADIPYTLVQSSKDEYLSLKQTEIFAKKTEATIIVLSQGRHDEVFEAVDLRKYLSDIF